MYEPLQPTVTFGQEDPVYWQLHRFLHWEEVRDTIPRRRQNAKPGDDDRKSGQRDYFTKAPYKTLSKGRGLERPPAVFNPAVDAYLAPETQPYRPIDRRERIIRKQYLEQFRLPGWMYDDLDRRPSPKKDAVHPWDLDPLPPAPVDGQPASTTNNNGFPKPTPSALPPTTSTTAGAGRAVRVMSPDDPKRLGKKTSDSDRRNTSVNADDPNVPHMLAAIKERHGKSGKKKHTEGESNNKASDSESDEGDESKTKQSTHVSRSKTKSSLESNTKKKKEKKLTLHQRAIKEYRESRKPKPKKKYIPMSKRIIKPPKERESWDDVSSTIGDVFNANKDFQPGSRMHSMASSTGGEDDERSETGERQKQEIVDMRKAAILSSLNKGKRLPVRASNLSLASSATSKKSALKKNVSKVPPMTFGKYQPESHGNSSLASSRISRRSALKKSGPKLAPVKASTAKTLLTRPRSLLTLNKYSALPGIGVNASTGVDTRNDFEATEAGAMTKKWVDAASQVNAFDVAVNTDIEQRDVGISTRDDVVYIYETVEVSRRHHNRHKHHHHDGKGNKKEDIYQHHNHLHVEHKGHRHYYHEKRRKQPHHHHHKSPSSSESTEPPVVTDEPNLRSSSESKSRSISRSISRSVSSRSSASLKASPSIGTPTSRRIRHDVNEAELKKQILSQLRFQDSANQQTTVEEPAAASLSKPGTGTGRVAQATSSRASSHKELSRQASLKKQPLSRQPSVKQPLSRTSSQNQALSRVPSQQPLSRTQTLKEKHQQLTKRDSSVSPPPTDRSNNSTNEMHPKLSKKRSNASENEEQKKKPLSRNNSHAPLVKTLSNSSANGGPSSRPRLGSAASSTDSITSGSIISSNAGGGANIKPSPRQNQPLKKTNSSSVQPRRNRALSIVDEGDPTKGDDGDDEDNRAQLIACRFCDRRFAIQRLAFHETACQRTHEKKRKVFDSRQRRISTFAGNDKALVEQAVRNQGKNAKTNKENKKDQWRQQHEAFIEQIRYAKKVTELEKTGGDIRSLGPAPKTFTGDLEPCPKCGRKFNSEAIKRHVPICKAEPIKRK